MTNMASHHVGPLLPSKLSFAKIAAMPAPSVKPALPNIPRDTKPKTAANTFENRVDIEETAVENGSNPSSVHRPVNIAATPHLDHVRSAMGHLHIGNQDAQPEQTLRGTGSGDLYGDDQSQLSASSLKQQNFETKSMTSVTTFAMDEKESIRPDDSASMRAAEEDELHLELSRNSSFQNEPEPHLNGSRVSVRHHGANVTISARRYPTVILANPPRFGQMPISPVVNEAKERLSIAESSHGEPELEDSHISRLEVHPDEKLLEALSSPKDRLSLLQLEERIVVFLTRSNDDVLDLPPQNSFTRLLTHKLSDYYNLARGISDDNGSVRIFRTGRNDLPTPLYEIAKSIPVGPVHANTAAQVKIMRRVQLGSRQFSAATSTAPSSSAPSKPTSENGVETASEEGLQSPLVDTPNRDKSKMTREEREAQYKAARERIFGDFQESVTSESGSTEATSASMSRSSSSSGKRRSRKNKTPKDDTFEARSAFVPSYAHLHTQSNFQQNYSEMQFPGVYSNTINNFQQNHYPTSPLQQYPQYDSGLSYGTPALYPTGHTYASDGWPNLGPQFNVANAAPFSQHPQILPQVNDQYQQSMQQMTHSQGWVPSQYSNPYTGSHSSNGQWQNFDTTPNMRNAVPYQHGQHGQLPSQTYNGGMLHNNQQPVPGSFANSKSLFNPQTRSFIPSSGPGRGGRNNRKRHNSGARNSNTPGYGTPLSARGDILSSQQKDDSLQQKYGTPANLPKKPPPSQNSPHFISDGLSSSTQATGGGAPLVVGASGRNE